MGLMTAAKAGWLTAAALVSAIGCSPGMLDPGRDPDPTTTGGNAGTAPMQGETAGTAGQAGAEGGDLVAAMKMLYAPDSQLIIGTNGGVVVPVNYGPTGAFPDRAPEALMEAAAKVGLKVCSIEPAPLSFSSATTAGALSTNDAVAFCASDDLAEMLQRLNGLKTPALVVVIAANTGATFHSTNNGINFFYNDDVDRLLRAARRLYVPACIIRPELLSLPMAPAGRTAGVSIEMALAGCGLS
jgi:hypothetical protein